MALLVNQHFLKGPALRVGASEGAVRHLVGEGDSSGPALHPLIFILFRCIPVLVVSQEMDTNSPVLDASPVVKILLAVYEP